MNVHKASVPLNNIVWAETSFPPINLYSAPKLKENKMKLIGIAGLARSGKDTAGKYLAKSLGLETYALASPIKKIVNDMFGWDERHSDGELKEIGDPVWGFSPRKAYQLFGTEFGRALRDDMWTKMAENKAKELGGLIVTDVRFENEASWIRSSGGIVIHVHRDSIKNKVRAHASEAGLVHAPTDWTVWNNESIEQFYSMLDDTIEDIREYYND
jgi:hypothetical protein